MSESDDDYLVMIITDDHNFDKLSNDPKTNQIYVIYEEQI